jgi:hypothetical protein
MSGCDDSKRQVLGASLTCTIFGVGWALRAGSELRGTCLNFGELRKGEVRRIHLLRRWVNKDKRKRLRYILSTQLLPLDVLRQELAGCILL